jgi:hexosaminidase
MMLERIAGYRPAGAIEALSTAVEPVKEYDREKAGKYTQFTPLNRLVDAAPAESVTAREFSREVDLLLAGDQGRREQLRKQALLWRDQHGELKQAFSDSFLAAEVEPVSADVSALGKAVIEALGYLADGNAAPPSWVDSQNRVFARAKAPRAELLVVILEPVEKLVKAAAAPK